MKKFQSLGRSLSKIEQKNIMGGVEDESVGGEGGCAFGATTSGTCGVRTGGATVYYGISQEEAQYIAGYCSSVSGHSWYWCCASC